MKSALMIAFSFVATLCATEPLPAGKAKVSITVGNETLDVFTYRPESYRDGPLLVVMHGIGRNANGYRDYAVPLADQPEELSSDTQMMSYLASPLTLYLGTTDILEKDLDMNAAAMLQGKTRFERGHACFEMAKALAKKRGWPFNWQLIEAPDVGHSAKAMFSHPQVLKTFSTAPKK